MANHREYLDEIKTQFKAVDDANKGLVKNAVYLMSFIGIIMATAVGLATYGDAEEQRIGITGIPGILLMVGSLAVCSWIIKPRDKNLPIGSKKLLKKCCDKRELNENYNKWVKADSEKYYRELSLSYLRSMELAEDTNKNLALLFDIARWLFVAGMAAFATLVLLIGSW